MNHAIMKKTTFGAAMDNHSPKVSIVVPCYNGAWCMHRLINSIIAQTYENIELIFVNDGSTDNSEAVFYSFRPALEARGIVVKYVLQENRGLGGAIDTGLSCVEGAFFCWPDIDDYLEPESVSLRVAAFAAHPNAGIVSSAAYVKNYGDWDAVDRILKDTNPHADHITLFSNLLQAEGLFCAGCHMARTDAFKTANGRMGIYPARRGQNWQLLLPLYYHFDRVTVDKPLYNYIVHENSMSQNDDSYEKKLFRADEHEQIILNTLASMVMSDDERRKYTDKALAYCARRNLVLANAHANKPDAKREYRRLLKLRAVTLRDLVFRFTIGSGLVEHYRKLRRGVMHQ